MFEKYIIVPQKAKNIEKDGQKIGFEFGVRLPYYRGLGISMVEDIQLKVDEKSVDPSKLTFIVDEKSYSLLDMQNIADVRWEMGEVATLFVEQKGGLGKGKHKLDVLINLRISYMPFSSVRKDSKIIELIS